MAYIRAWTLIAFILMASLIGCAVQHARPSEDIQKEAEYNYKMGVSSLNEGNLKMAYVQLHKSYELDPNNKETLNSLGIVFMQLGDDVKALEFFKRVIEMDSRFSEAYNNMGVLYLQKGRFNDAVTAFRQALANPLYQYPERAYYNLGSAYYRNKQYDDAISAFQSSARLSQDFAMPYYGLALALNKKGDYGGAVSMLGIAVSLDQKYKGNMDAFKKDMASRANASRSSEAEDSSDYLEIMKY